MEQSYLFGAACKADKLITYYLKLTGLVYSNILEVLRCLSNHILLLQLITLNDLLMLAHTVTPQGTEEISLVSLAST